MTNPQRILTLHIGTGKAGSTSIQHALAKLDPHKTGLAPIKAFGQPNAIDLTMASGTPQARRYFVEKHTVVSAETFDRLNQTVWETAAREVQTTPTTRFAASSEFLCTMVRREAVVALKDRLDQIFDQVQIVAYLRDQRSFLRSLWAQSVKGPSRSADSFQHFLDTLGERKWQWNYSLFLNGWLNAFGPENTKVSMFDPRALYQGDVVSDLLRTAGATDTFRSAQGKQNVSPDNDALEEIRQANQRRKGLNALQDSEIWDPARYDAFVLDHVSAGNRWVNDRFFKDRPFKLPTHPAP